MSTKFLTVPIALLRIINNNEAIILSYIYYRLRFNVSFIESNKQMAEVLGLSECGVAKIMRKLKQGGYIGCLCKRHSEIVIGRRDNPLLQKTITKAYCRKSWLTKTGERYFKRGE